MNALARIAETLFPSVPHVAAGDDPVCLAAIADPAINLAIWRRPMAPALAMDTRRLLAEAAGDVRLTTAPAALADGLSGAVAAAGWPAAPALVADVAELARVAAPLMQTAALDVRLEIITGDACRKFHADYVPLRLITSYAGPGSQWLSNEDAAALADGTAIDQLDVRQLLAGEVALFKGRLRTDTPIIHRSPPIAGSGQKRLVLVINPAPPEDQP
jgi:hypothetical protein